MNKNLKNALIDLLKVKSIVTIVLTGVFAYLSIIREIDTQNFMAVFMMIIGFYFGTQLEKKKKETTPETEEAEV